MQATRRTGAIGLVAMAALLAGCQSQPNATAKPAAAAPLISEADATKLADATEAAWLSMDAARIKALYAPGIVGFDIAAPPLATDRATWDKQQDAFAAAKLDKSVTKQRHIQVLDGDTFVVSGVWDLTSTATPANDARLRCTDVYEKAADGTWPIVNEHCSLAPKG